METIRSIVPPLFYAASFAHNFQLSAVDQVKAQAAQGATNISLLVVQSKYSPHITVQLEEPPRGRVFFLNGPRAYVTVRRPLP